MMKIDSIFAAQERILSYVKPSPLIYSYGLSKRTGRRIWLKLETQHPTGSFKWRPALHGVLTHLDSARTQGIITSSSGNFAQAVALAAREFRVKARIVMTNSTLPYKIQRTQELGAEVVLVGPSFQERWEATFRLQKELGSILIHPYDSEETIAADGTIGLELLNQLEGNFTVLAPVSGGGLFAGISMAVIEKRPGCSAVAVQPAANGSMIKSLAAGRPMLVSPGKTVADALTAAKPGDLSFSLIQKYGKDVVLVEEDEILEAVRFLREEQKLVVEPGGAVTVASLLSHKTNLDSTDIVCVLSGGNSSGGQ